MDDDDSDEDSDFVPGSDNNDENDGDGGRKSIGPDMSNSRKRKVDLLWEDIQMDDKNFIQSMKQKVAKVGNIKKSKEMKPNCKVLSMLSSIFGPSQALKLCQNNVNDKEPNFEEKRSFSSELNENRQDLLKIAKNVQKKVKVVEKRRFAGKDIRFATNSRLVF